MAKKMTGENPVDEAYLRSLMAGTPVEPPAAVPVYIDRELHRKISVIVGIAGKRQLTVGNYIDNVLREHFENHSDEVKAYCQKSYNKIF